MGGRSLLRRPFRWLAAWRRAEEKEADAAADRLARYGPGLGFQTHNSGGMGARAIVPVLLLRPSNTAEVSAILKLCNDAGQPLAPQGGMTGLVSAAAPLAGEISLSVERMNRIEEIDPYTSTMTVEAGVVLQSIQEQAEAHGLLFPLDLGARGSATIGGNLSTNAGGNRVIRYGMTRDLVVGVEAVLADGTVIDGLHKLRKNNTGYDLKQLFIGSEGTLGLITKAVLKLTQKPNSQAVAMCSVDSFANVADLLVHCQATLGANLSAFEVIWQNSYKLVEQHMSHVTVPLDADHGFYVLVESMGSDKTKDTDLFFDLKLGQGKVPHFVVVVVVDDKGGLAILLASSEVRSATAQETDKADVQAAGVQVTAGRFGGATVGVARHVLWVGVATAAGKAGLVTEVELAHERLDITHAKEYAARVIASTLGDLAADEADTNITLRGAQFLSGSVGGPAIAVAPPRVGVREVLINAVVLEFPLGRGAHNGHGLVLVLVRTFCLGLGEFLIVPVTDSGNIRGLSRVKEAVILLDRGELILGLVIGEVLRATGPATSGAILGLGPPARREYIPVALALADVGIVVRV